MDHYLTTYKKDYLWPNLPDSGGAGTSEGGQKLAEYVSQNVKKNN